MTNAPSPRPLVSVVMPAYKATYLKQALESVRRQTYRPLELVVCDDSPGDRVQAIVEAFAAQAGFAVRYSRNPSRLGETRSTARAIGLASGEFIKFLHDDDALHYDCVATLVEAFERVPGLALAAARRRLVDEASNLLPDQLATAFPVREDVLIDGRDLIDFLADRTVNFLGEPSSVMCRRAPLLEIGDRLAVLDGVAISWVADLALYAKLMLHGPVAMTARVLVDFRVSRQQFSQHGRDRPGVGDPGHEAFRSAIRSLGWYRGGDTGQVSIAPLDGSRPARRIDLPQALEDALAVSQRMGPLRDWWLRRRPNPAQLRIIQEQAGSRVRPPVLGVLVRAQDCDAKAVRRTLSSLVLPPALAGRLSVRGLGDALPGHDLPAPFPPLVRLAGGPGASLDAAISDWDVDWLVLVDGATEFTGGGLIRLLLELDGQDAATRAVVADEWHRDGEGGMAPVLRPGLNLDLLLGNPAALAGHWVFRRQAVLDAGGFDSAMPGAEEFDLILRMLEQGGLGGIAHLPEPLLLCDPPPPREEAQRNALVRHLHSRGYTQARVESAGPGLHRIHYGHDRGASVSLVVVAGDDFALLQRCVLSVLEKTGSPDYELLLVDPGDSAEAGAWMRQVEALAGGRVRVLALDAPVPHAAACNLAAGHAHGEFLLFLRAEAAVVQPGWLEALLNHGLRPEVGIVGARTVSADGHVTHAGLVPGLLQGDGRAFLGEPMSAPGYLARLQVARDCAAVADDCLLVARELFLQLDGFDAAAFPRGGADVDLCLRAGAAGFLTVCTPDALLLHSPALRGEAEAAQVRDALCERWLPQLADDPDYSPSLRLELPGGFRLGESDFSWQPLPWRPLPRVLAQPADPWGSGQYRVIQPFQALRAAGLVEGCGYARLLDPVELARIDPDVVVMQRRVSEDDIARMRRMRRFSRAFAVYELDDWLPNLPLKNAHRADLPADIVRSLRAALAQVDRFVVATPALAEAFAGYHERIRVVQNRLEPGLWGWLPGAPARPTTERPRVGWAGGLSHDGDLEMIADVVRELAGEVDWVFFGMCPERLRPYVKEFHPGVDFHAYPRALALLGLDLALAPLEDNAFNRCKSHLRLLEYGACGYPVICSDLESYRGDLPVTRVRNRYKDWVGAIRQHLAEREATAAAGQALREAVRRDWMLQGPALEEWRSAWLPD